MKSDSDWGLSSPRTRLDDTCLNANSNNCHWRLNIAHNLTDLTYNNDKHSLDKRFIGSERYWYRSWKYNSQHLRNRRAATFDHLTFNISDSRRRGFV